MDKIKVSRILFLFFNGVFCFLVFNNLAIGSSFLVNETSFFVVGTTGKLSNELSSLGCSKEEKSQFYELIKKSMKGDFSAEMFEGYDWKNQFLTKKFLVKNQNKKNHIAILEVYPPASKESYFCFLLKDKDANKWSFVNVIKTCTKYYDSNIFYCRLKNHEFVSLIDSTGGTGVWYSWYQMYLLKNGKLEKIIDFPSEGQRNTWGLDYDVEFKIKNPGVKEDCFVLPLFVDYYAGKSVDLSIGYKELKLFSKKYNFRYVWDEEKNKFFLDKATSNPANNTEEAILLDGPQEKFLTIYYEELKDAVIRGGKKKKRWLMNFLKNCEVKTDEEKKDVEQLLKLLSPTY